MLSPIWGLKFKSSEEWSEKIVKGAKYTSFKAM